MNSKQIQLVQETFNMVGSSADEVAALVYQRLFELEPGLRPLFKSDLHQQGKKLMSTLALVVNGLTRPERILAAVQHLGQRHAGYGVREEDYETVGQALIWTLAQTFGTAFTPEIAEAWVEAYTMLANIMQEAAAVSMPMAYA
jgi:hemoglobin-like flavoprotein